MVGLTNGSASGMRSISPFEFVRRFRHAITRHESRFVWFLGAGCSVSSGVGDAAQISARWLKDLKYLETGDSEGVPEWAEGRFLNYDRADPAGVYGEVLDALFYTDQDRQREIERLVASAEPGFGYATLAQLVADDAWGERCNTLLTTNFDDLAADALYLYSQRKPQVLTHESLGRRVRVTTMRPTIIKIHGDAHLGAQYLDGDRRLLDKDVKERLRAQLTEAGLIFIGYGGRDESVIDLLEGLPRGAPAGGVFWINAAPPGPALRRWLESRGAICSPHSDFDALMYLMRREFGLGAPRIDRFDQILRKYDDQFKGLAERADLRRMIEAAEGQAASGRPVDAPAKSAPSAPVALESAEFGGFGARTRIDALIAAAVKAMASRESEQAAPELRETPPPPEAREPERQTPEILEVAARVSAARDIAVEDAPQPADMARMRRFIAPRRKASSVEPLHADRREVEPTPTVAPAPAPADATIAPPAPPKRLLPREQAIEMDRIWRDALEAAPGDARLMSRYAAFLAIGRRDYDAAEHYFNRAVDADPQNEEAWRRFARFLSAVRGEHDRAEDCYRLAIKAELTDARTLCEYAEFLWRTRGDFAAAEDCHRLAIDVSPRNPDALRRYAGFLHTVRGNDDAAYAVYKFAAAIEPRDPQALIDLARFLARRRGETGRALAFLEEAATLDDGAAAHLARAEILETGKADLAAAEAALDAAVKADPADPAARLARAEFLLRRGAEASAAEEALIQAIQADSGSATTLAAYARFLEENRADLDEAEEFYRRAARAEPGSAQAQTELGSFLHRARRDLDGAEERLRKAVALAPRSPSALRAFGRFLRDARGDLDRAEQMFRRAVEAAPRDAAALIDLAVFLRETRGDFDGAEQMFRRAVAAEPDWVRALAPYARFIGAVRRDFDAADAMFARALASAPNDAAAQVGRAQLLLMQGRTAEGLALLDEAHDAAYAGDHEQRQPETLLDLWFSRYAFDNRDRRGALKSAIGLIRVGARLSRVDLEGMIRVAAARGHPEPDILRDLGRAASGEAGADALAAYVA